MDSADGAADRTLNGHEGHERSKSNFFKSHTNDNKPSEEAPLLVDEAFNEEENVENPRGTSEYGTKNFLQQAWYWLRNHFMMVVIVLLLIGGIVALSIYFAEFDKYVCQGFNEKHDLRADQDILFTGTLMAENAQQILRHVLGSPLNEDRVDAASTADRQIFEKIQAAYNACMDEERLRDVGSAPLLAVLRQIDTLFPVKAGQKAIDRAAFPRLQAQKQLGISLEGDNQLSRTVTYLASIGVTSLVAIGVGADDKDPDTVVPSVNAPRQPGLPSKQYYKDPKIVARYGRVIGQVLEALLEEASPNSTVPSTSSMFFSQSAELVERILLFESKMAEATPETEDAQDVTFYYNPLTFDEIRHLLPQLSLLHVVSVLAPDAPHPSKVIVGSPGYLKALARVLKQTDTETLQAYFVWKTVQSYAYKVEDDALKPLKRFNNELQGKDADATEERWRTCVRVADYGLGWILSKFFIENAFSEDAKNFGDQIVSDIKIQFIEKLKNAQWMSKEVRDLGIEKVHAIVQKIGYPTKSPDVRDASDIQQYYETVNITNTTFFANALSIADFDTKHEWSALGKPTNRDEWDMTADTVNAYYNPPGNEIVFPAGIMQKPVFYDPSVPQYLSYGAFGAVSGHELSHAFDSTGRHYDETGNFTDWWNNDTVQAFKEKAQCFVDQYEKFTVPNPGGEPLHLNGRLTLGENIADSGGLNAAFAAWEKIEAKHQSQLLPGLQHFTKKQMFFISYSNWWCGKIRPEAAVNAVYRDPHAPTWARILACLVWLKIVDLANCALGHYGKFERLSGEL